MRWILVALTMAALSAAVASDSEPEPVNCTDGSCGSDLDCEMLCGGEVEL